jgi:ribose/xylose/arabinose/galactoside ABC-type transport system permease subunit
MIDAAQPENLSAEGGAAARARHPLEHPVRRLIDANRAALGTFAVLVVMMAIFIAASPEVFLEWNIYRSVLTTLPVALFLVVPLVFVVTAGEIDLSFPSTMGFSAWMFALVVQAGFSPYLGLAAAMAMGALLGFLVGSLVVYFRLSSLIATLGMNFMLRGVIQIVAQGKSIALVSLEQSSAKSVFSGVLFGVPTQMLWALVFVVFLSLLFQSQPVRRPCEDRRRQLRQRPANGDRRQLGAGQGLRVGRDRSGARWLLLYDDQLHLVADLGRRLPAAGACFRLRRRHAYLGRRRHCRRRGDRRLDRLFIQTGIVGAGFSGFYVQFFNGLIIILSLIGHRWNQIRYR